MDFKRKFELIKNKTSLAVGRAGLKIQKNSPKILLVAGIMGFGGTIILASKETLAAEDIIKDHKRRIDAINDAKKIAIHNPDIYEYDEELIKADKVKAYCRTAVSLSKLYAPAIALGAFSITCVLISNNIINNRYLGAVAAYNGVSKMFEKYRSRVIEEQGSIMDHHYYYGTDLETVDITETDENGKKHKTKALIEKPRTEKISISDCTDRYFNSKNVNWEDEGDYPRLFLTGQQRYFQDILDTRGHIFLNEVYDALGFAHTPEGALLGWVKDYGDNEIDFGFMEDQDFVNGLGNGVLLKFNICREPIWDKI